jgi:hypothetical protein
MKIHSMVAGALALSIGGAAQHTGHAPDASPELVTACIEAQQRVVALADQAAARLETARQSNSPREMRAAVAELQAMLVEIRTEAAGCAPLQTEGKIEPPR